MIALDTNILARFYVDDPADPQAAQQRPIARRLLTQDRPVFVPLTVVLELESVLRAFYGFAADDFVRVVQHLLGLANVTVEEWARVSDALALHKDGLDFADALHAAQCPVGERFVTFDKRLVRGASKAGLRGVTLLKA